MRFTAQQIEENAEFTVIRFTMEDTGIGMEKAFLPRLYDPFVQEDATTTNRYGGSGLGMAITKNMIDLMDGSIPVIALTANAFEEDVKQCLEAGMNAHLSKPVDIDQLTKLLGRFLTERNR